MKVMHRDSFLAKVPAIGKEWDCPTLTRMATQLIRTAVSCHPITSSGFESRETNFFSNSIVSKRKVIQL
jgi:hypothetical protein